MQRDIYPEGELSAEDRKVREEESLRTQLIVAPKSFFKLILILNLIWNFLFEQRGNKIQKSRYHTAKCI